MPPEAPTIGTGAAPIQAVMMRCVTPAVDHAGEVVQREEARAEEPLDLAAEHVEREHVEEDVREVGVQEAVGDELPGLEMRLEPARRPQRERARVEHAGVLEHDRPRRWRSAATA